MTCRYCGTELPVGALFCGECGQPVSTTASSAPAPSSSSAPSASPPLRSAGFSIADLAFSSPGETSEPDADGRDLPDGSAAGPSDAGVPAYCPQCGEAMAEGDVFCGECGFVVRTVWPPTRAEAPAADPEPEDADDPAEPEEPEEPGEPAEPEEPAEPGDPDEPDDEPGDPVQPRDPDATTEIDPLSSADAPAVLDELVIGRDSPFAPAPTAVEAVDPDLEFDDPPFSEVEAQPAVTASPRSRPIPDPFPWGTDQPIREDLEATRLVAESAPGTRYVLQFSTGESVTVSGSGLIGRNPSMQPGEYVDQLVPIFDAGKSVSKTHLEFGQEAGRFWVSDRYSTNGSVIRQPDSEPRRCDPGRRYFIARGTRVDVGEQFFVVS